MFGIICGGIICLCSAFVGGAIGNRYRARLRIANEWERFNREMLANVRFVKRPVSEFIESYREGMKGAFAELMQRYGALCADGKANESEISALTAKVEVDRKMRNVIREYFFKLGKTDEENQLRTLEYYQGVLSDYTKACDKLCRTNGKLAERLGLLIGLAVMIMMV